LSPCKVNLVLNILGKRPDGYHGLETLFHPVPLHDELTFESNGAGIHLTCNHPDLPTDSSNLVHKAASLYFQSAGVHAGVRIHLDKRLPLAAGLGAGSANAAHTLLALNELFGSPLPESQLGTLAASLGSDVNFFLQDAPALATGRGEQVEPLAPFNALKGTWILLFHPGFGIATAWAYRELSHHPDALNGRPGRALEFARLLESGRLEDAGRALYNSLEAPALRKYPVLGLYQEFLRAHGAFGALMSGSGSTTFALFRTEAAARQAAATFRIEFGAAGWLGLAAL
jgi:4-diphosphocytidyl-2-C-methyl-D-erythritol kinase